MSVIEYWFQTPKGFKDLPVSYCDLPVSYCVCQGVSMSVPFITCVCVLQDLDPLVPQQLSDLDADISSAISQDVSLRDAMVTGSVYDMIPPRGGVRTLVARQPRGPLFRLVSANSSNSSPGTTTGLAALPNVAVVNGTRNGSSSHGALEGCLDEAVFDQINLLGLDGCLETMDAQLLGILQGMDPRVLEDLDSDSGLSLESSSRGPDSPSELEDLWGCFREVQCSVFPLYHRC